MKALLIGRKHNLAWALPELLANAGFSVDVITSSPFMKYSKFVADCEYLNTHEPLPPRLSKRLNKNYDWIIITEDGILHEIVHSSLSIEEKRKLLPVSDEKYFSHLFSKIHLSRLLKDNAITTPPFLIAHSFTEALLNAEQLGYPLLIKEDKSSGGTGVFECSHPSDLSSIPKYLFSEPVLVQKKITGIELDLSAIYLKGELVHFSYAKQEKTCRPFGPSFLRTYSHLSSINPKIFQELRTIGKALGIHGFTNIACIESKERTRFYFEVDVRPNAWIGYSKFLGEDPSIRIRNWFSQKKTLQDPIVKTTPGPTQLVIPYFLRLNRWELLTNRYRVWLFIPRKDWKLVFWLILNKMSRQLFSLFFHFIPGIFHRSPHDVRKDGH